MTAWGHSSVATDTSVERGARRERRSITFERRMRRWGGGPGLLGYTVIAIVVGIALLLYFLGAHGNALNGGRIGARGTWFVVGEASGIASAVLLAVVVIMASRAAVLELLFGDLTKVYVAHGVVGMTMFALVSIHPMMYLAGGLGLGNFVSAAHVLVPFHVVVLDWVSYIAIAVALIPTMYMRLSFAWWRASHLLLGGAMILTGYSILIDSTAFDTARIPALRYYLYVVFGVATIAFIWVALLRRLAEPKREYKIIGAQYHAGANAIELSAVPVGRPARFEAGQFTYVDLLDDQAQVKREFEAHPFSIASRPGQEPLSLVIEGAGGHTERIQRIAAGDQARALLHGAYGRLEITRPERTKQLWLAGGIGITPFVSMAHEMAADRDCYRNCDVILIVGVDRPDQAFKLAELEQCTCDCERCDCGLEPCVCPRPGLRVHLWDRSQRGLPTVAAIAEEFVDDLPERDVMISGPEVMISEVTRQLLAAGLHRGQIRSERAIGPPGRWHIASPALRYTRDAVTLFFTIFVVAVIVSVVARAIGT